MNFKTIILGIFLSVSTLFSSEILWQTDFEKAFAQAKKEHKVVMLMVEGKHCQWCKKMKKSTLHDPKVLKYLSEYIPLKIMRGDKAVTQQLPIIYGVPTVFFMSENKEVLESVVGYFGVNDFISYIKDVEKKVKAKAEKKQHAMMWYSQIDKAFLAAKKEKKRVMVMVEDAHCRWCKKMKQGTLKNEKVQEKLSHYILLKIDRANSEDMEALQGLHGPIPSFHLYDQKKHVLDTIAGYYASEDFLDYLEELSEELK
jgi:thioredoxin-related protein